MRFIWQHPEGISSKEIYDHFPQARGTKSTILYNISEKGYVKNEQQGLHHFYTPEVTRLEYERAVVRQQLKQVFGEGSLERLVAAFCGKKDLNKQEAERVKELIDELEHDVEDE